MERENVGLKNRGSGFKYSPWFCDLGWVIYFPCPAPQINEGSLFLRFTAKLSRKHRKSPYTSCFCSAQLPSLSTSILERYIHYDKRTLTPHYHSTSLIYTEVNSWCHTFYGFWETHDGVCPPLQKSKAQFHCTPHPVCSASACFPSSHLLATTQLLSSP